MRILDFATLISLGGSRVLVSIKRKQYCIGRFSNIYTNLTKLENIYLTNTEILFQLFF